MESAAAIGVHHVVWCVKPEHLERVRTFWERVIGLALEQIDLPELGLRVLISWTGGVEIMTPAYEHGSMAEAARAFLAERGEGVYSVVYGVRDIDGVIASFEAFGGRLLFRESITPDEVEARRLSDGDRFAILQAGFDDECGMRICLQELRPE